MSEAYYIGMDLCSDSTQISFYNDISREPETVNQLNNKETYMMPNILFSPDFIAAQDSPVFSDYMEPVIFSNRSFLVFRRNQENQHCGPVADGAEEHKDVPDAVEIRPFVVGEEISAARVKQALKENAQQCRRGERQENRFGHKHHAPAHDEVEQQ